jgi:hypothetical protein
MQRSELVIPPSTLSRIHEGKHRSTSAHTRDADSPQDGELLLAVLGHGIEDGLGLEAGSLERGAAQVLLGGVASQTNDAARGRVVPVRSEETREGRDDVDTTGVLDLRGELADLGRVVNERELVAEPLDGGTGDGDGTLERVDGLGVGSSLVGRGGEKTVGRRDNLVSGVEAVVRGSISELLEYFPVKCSKGELTA